MFGETTDASAAAFFDLTQIVLNLGATLILSLLIAWVYRSTHHGLSYSQGFVASLIFASLVACGAIMVIGASIARAFGLVGALSIIRYRTVVKDTRDASFIFLALVTGFACGTANFLVGALTTAFVLIVALVIHRFRFGVLKEHDFVLTLAAGPAASHVPVLDRFCSRSTLLHVEPGATAAESILTFDVSLKEGFTGIELVESLRSTAGVTSPRLIFAKGDPNF
jgi:hypothetical protein